MDRDKLLELAAEVSTIANVLEELLNEVADETSSNEFTYDGPGYPRISDLGDGTRRVELNPDTSVVVSARHLPQLGGGSRPSIYPGVGQGDESLHFYFVPGIVTQMNPDERGITNEFNIKQILERLEKSRV